MERLRFLCLILGLALMMASCGTPEEKKMAFYDKGMALYGAGDYTRARLEFKNAIQIDPEFAQGHYQLARTALKLKDARGAFKEFNLSLRFDPDLIDARMDLARMFFAARVKDRAMAQVDEILKRAPDHHRAKLLRVSLLLADKKLQEAQAFMDALTAMDPQPVDYFLILASIRKMTGDVAGAGQALEEGFSIHDTSLALALALAKYHGQVGDLGQVEAYLKKAVALAPDNVELKFNLAWLHLKTKDTAQAVDTLQGILSANPREDKYRTAAATLLLKAGEMVLGEDFLRKGMEKNPTFLGYYALLAEIRLKQKQMDKAERLFKKYLSLGDSIARPDQIKARLSLGKLILLQRRIEEADTLVDEILTESPNHVDANYLKGRIALVKEDGPGAVSRFRSVINEHPDQVNAYIGLAHAHGMNTDFDLALDVLKTAQKKSPDSTGILETMVRMNLGKKDLAAAEENLKKIVSLDPYNLGSIAGLGDFYLSMNRFDEAMAQYELLKKSKKASPFGYLRTAQVLARQNKVDQAIEEMISGYGENKKSSVFITSLAQLYMKEGRWADAIEKLKEALAIDPGNWFARFSLAQIHERNKDYISAVAVYRDLLTHHPDSWRAANNLSFYLAELGTRDSDLDEALGYAMDAKRLNPGSPLILDTIGWVFYKKGMLEKAEEEIQRAYKMMPDNESICYHLGVVSHELGKGDQAREKLSQALAVRHDFMGKKEASLLFEKYYAN